MKGSYLTVACVIVLCLSTARAESEADCKTQFAPGFSEAALAKVRPGMTQMEARALLGPSLREEVQSTLEIWRYGDPSELDQLSPEELIDRKPFPTVAFSDGAVVHADGTTKVSEGMSAAAVENALGKPQSVEPERKETRLHYTSPGACSTYKLRVVVLGSDATVTSVVSDDNRDAHAGDSIDK